MKEPGSPIGGWLAGSLERRVSQRPSARIKATAGIATKAARKGERAGGAARRSAMEDNSRTTSAADWGRWAGSFSSSFETNASIAGGTPERSREGAGSVV